MSALFPGAVETDRLRLERFCHDNVDVLSYYDVVSAEGFEEVTRYLARSPHDTPSESESSIDDAEKRWRNGTTADYLVRPRDGEPTPSAGSPEGPGSADRRDGGPGFAGQATMVPEWNRRRAGVGSWLRKPFWGRGYFGEYATALTALAFDRLDLGVVALTHHVDNEKSRRAIEKFVARFGGQRDGLLRNWNPHDDEVADEVLYTVTREGWDANHPGEDAVTFGDE